MTVAPPPSSQILVKTNAWIGGTKDQMARRPIDQNNQGALAREEQIHRSAKQTRPPSMPTYGRQSGVTSCSRVRKLPTAAFASRAIRRGRRSVALGIDVFLLQGRP